MDLARLPAIAKAPRPQGTSTGAREKGVSEPGQFEEGGRSALGTGVPESSSPAVSLARQCVERMAGAAPEAAPCVASPGPKVASGPERDSITRLKQETPFRREGRRMSKRSGQCGQVFVRNGRFVGRYYVDTPERRIRKAVVLGLKSEMTKPEARRRLLEIIWSCPHF